MKRILVATAAMALMLPTFGAAATYEYIDRSGTVRTVEAADAEEALALSAPHTTHSGVKLGTQLYGAGLQAAHQYRYVNMMGELKTIAASSPYDAYLRAADRMPTSGVQLVE